MKVLTALKKTLCILVTVGAVLLTMLPGKQVNAWGPTDEILSYTVTVDPLDTTSGSMVMDYKISWKVLDESTAGPLKEVKIGIPNYYAENFEAVSDNIRSVGFYKNDFGIFAKVKFKKAVRQGETIDFEFKFTQHNLFRKPDKDRKIPKTSYLFRCPLQAYKYSTPWDDLYAYVFTPGWFDAISIDQLDIYWRADKVIKADNAERIGEYCHWCAKDIAMGQRVTILVGYPKSAFDYVHKSVFHMDDAIRLMKIAGIVVVLAAFCFVWAMRFAQDSDEGIEFGDSRHYGSGGSGNSGGGGGGSGCACACAGGGRAGCSKKDFYGTKLETVKMRNALRNGMKKDADGKDL